MVTGSVVVVASTFDDVMNPVERPLSPHLQIYQPQLTSVLSITHRGTGIFLSFGLLFIPFWLLNAMAGPARYAVLQAHLAAWYGQLLLCTFAFSFFYHLCNGIRHLFWDAGFGFSLPAVYRSGYLTVAVSLLLTLLSACWVLLR